MEPLRLSCARNFSIENTGTVALPAIAGHTCTYYSSLDRLIVVGGYTGSERLSSVFYADKALKCLREEDYSEWKHASANGFVGRAGHCAHLVDLQGGLQRLFVFGGYDSKRNDLADAFYINPDDFSFEHVSYKGALPTMLERRWHASAPLEAKIIIHGGWNDNGPSNETLIFDSHEKTWTNLKPSSMPSARRWHKILTNPFTGDLFMFGGYDGNGPLGDLWTFKPETSSWAPAPKPSSSRVIPTRRCRHNMVWLDSKRLLVFGGFSSEKSTIPEAVSQIFHLDDSSWSNVSSKDFEGSFELSRSGNAVCQLSSNLATSVAGIDSNGKFCEDIVSITY